MHNAKTLVLMEQQQRSEDLAIANNKLHMGHGGGSAEHKMGHGLDGFKSSRTQPAQPHTGSIKSIVTQGHEASAGYHAGGGASNKGGPRKSHLGHVQT